MQRFRSHLIDAIIIVAIILGIWLLRATHVDEFVTWDEPAWVYRSVHFLSAISRGEWAGTLLTGHPGVLTTWCGALSLAWHRSVTGLVSAADLAAVEVLPLLDVHDLDTLRLLVRLLPAAKDGILVAHSLVAAALYLLLARLLGRRQALVGALFVGVAPYYLALSRVLHIDALSSGLMLLSVVGLLLYTRPKACGGERRADLLISGICTGLAVLTKSYALLLVPVAGAFLLLADVQRGESGRELVWLRDGAIWGVAAFAAFVVLWPAMWVAPVKVVGAVIGLSLGFAAQAGDATAGFFLGQATAEPGALFYPVALFSRATPLTLIGTVCAVGSLFLPRRQRSDVHITRRRIIPLLFLYVFFYLIVISIADKKYDRYILPALLGLDLLAALGLMGGLEWLLHRMTPIVRRWGTVVAAVTVVLVQAAVLLEPVWPAHYLAYFNPWVGGLHGAANTVPVGWGEGVEQAVRHLADYPDAADLTVATWSTASIARDFPGRSVILSPENIHLADYVLIYIGDVQTGDHMARAFYGEKEPEYVARINGLEYAWVYRNDYVDELTALVDEAVPQFDAIILDQPSAFQRTYAGSVPIHLVDAPSEEEVVSQLEAAAQGVGNLAYISFGDGDGPLSAVERQLTQAALHVWEAPFACGRVVAYRLPEKVRFGEVRADTKADVTLGDVLRLDRYGLWQGDLQYRQALGVTLEWTALRAMAHDYHLFIHVVDGHGRKWGQWDGPLSDDALIRTSAWRGETPYRTRHTVTLDAGIPPGEYEVRAGLYTVHDHARLPIAGAGTEYSLGNVYVIAAQVPATLGEMDIPQPADLRLGAVAQIVGYALADEPVTSGEEIDLTLFWRSLSPTNTRYELRLWLERDGHEVHFDPMPPMGEDYPTDRWTSGEMLRYPYRLHVPPETPGGVYGIYLNLYGEEDGVPLLDNGLYLADVQIEYLQRMFSLPEIESPLYVEVGDSIELLGYDLPTTQAQPGESVELTLYWRARQRTDMSFTVFVHLLDEGGQIIGQQDSVPVGGTRPTTGWMPDEIIVDRYVVPVQDGAGPGVCRIALGMYDPASGARLPLRDETGEGFADDRLLLDRLVTIEAPTLP
ncbi:MAG: ArnT family glycosyltransferase [Anaerolineae bacterium]|jgi:hypothetical protein